MVNMGQGKVHIKKKEVLTLNPMGRAAAFPNYIKAISMILWVL